MLPVPAQLLKYFDVGKGAARCFHNGRRSPAEWWDSLETKRSCAVQIVGAVESINQHSSSTSYGSDGIVVVKRKEFIFFQTVLKI